MVYQYIGAHIPKNGSTINTMKNITNNGGNAIQIFVSNPRSIQPANIQKYQEESQEIINYCLNNNFKIVIHAPYTINLGKSTCKRTVEYKDNYSINLILNNLLISDMINAVGVVFHVGKYTTSSPLEGYNNMFNSMKYIIQQMREKNIKSKLILETPAGAGTELLTNIKDFIEFYNSFDDNDKPYMGICLDTAHIWSSGYEIIDYYNTISKTNLNDIIVIHYNNSKKDKGSHVDVHETILEGKIDVNDMKMFIKKLKKQHIIILEKPSTNIKADIDWIKHQ